jgi:hypothetical protein
LRAKLDNIDLLLTVSKRPVIRKRRRSKALSDYDVDCSISLNDSVEEVVAVEFEEDNQTRTVKRDQGWKLRTYDDLDLNFDTITPGQSVLAYWSPMRTFYAAKVTAAPTGKSMICMHLLACPFQSN